MLVEHTCTDGSLRAATWTDGTFRADGNELGRWQSALRSYRSNEFPGLFIENRDSTTHSFDIDSLNIHVQLPANGTIAVAIKPAQAGAVEFYCAIGGHKAAGMDGTINIS
jgi:uncharacterized cupredoxin-like copper-binding protein